MVVAKVFLDYVTFIAQAQNKIFMAVVGVDFHDVPENWPLANRHHGFGTESGLFAQARSHTAAKNDYFHKKIVCRLIRYIFPTVVWSRCKSRSVVGVG